jgi:2-polyprenyl-3-methyl-5-hydroxy-6-metoxy-1,4-benzoquinol methylase
MNRATFDEEKRLSSDDAGDLVRQMAAFVDAIPSSLGIDWVKEEEFLRYFEAPRIGLIQQLLFESGWKASDELHVLDFGYLHGLIPEFLHRAFPSSTFTVCDLPESPILTDACYRKIIGDRQYLELKPLNIENVNQLSGTFDVIILGEIIEHLDPTRTAKALKDLHLLSTPRTTLVVTTPNAISIKNVAYALDGRDAQHPPVADRVMGYGHIHLWSHALLRKTMAALGWEPVDVAYFHGFEEWDRQRVSCGEGSLKWRMVLRILYAVAERVPRWRGYFVSTWRIKVPERGTDGA